MNNFLEELKKYFEVTPQSKVMEDWAKSKEFDKIGPTVEEFLENSQHYNVYINDPNNYGLQNNTISPKFTSGFLLNFNFIQNAKSCLFLN